MAAETTQLIRAKQRKLDQTRADMAGHITDAERKFLQQAVRGLIEEIKVLETVLARQAKDVERAETGAALPPARELLAEIGKRKKALAATIEKVERLRTELGAALDEYGRQAEEFRAATGKNVPYDLADSILRPFHPVQLTQRTLQSLFHGWPRWISHRLRRNLLGLDRPFAATEMRMLEGIETDAALAVKRLTDRLDTLNSGDPAANK
jgi:hypothetical protein